MDDMEQKAPLCAEVLRLVVETDAVVKNQGHSQEKVWRRSYDTPSGQEPVMYLDWGLRFSFLDTEIASFFKREQTYNLPSKFLVFVGRERNVNVSEEINAVESVCFCTQLKEIWTLPQVSYTLKIPLHNTSFSKYSVLGEACTDLYYSPMSGM